MSENKPLSEQLGFAPFREGHHYEIDPETGCWVWQLFRFRGYGRTGDGAAHRVMYAAVVGPIPAAHDLHHRCENPACINPQHLEPVTRSAHLAAHKQTKSRLRPDDVVAIRERAAGGESLTALGREFNVSEDAILLIAQGKTWRNVGGPTQLRPRFCAQCGEMIAGRNRMARFCCDSHRLTFNSRKQTERRQLERARS